MKISREKFTIPELHSLKNNIDTNPVYQRLPVWKMGQKQLLMDSIVRGYDIPKIYMKRTEKGKDKFEVVDGQQRLRTIWNFCDGKISLPKDARDINGINCKKKKHGELDKKLMKKFNKYTIDVIIIEESEGNDEFDEVRDMFERLQNGTSLNEQEKRNAMTGKMHDFVKEMSEHNFLKSCNFKNARFSHDQMVAQLICIEMEGGPTSIKTDSLTAMYKEYIDFKPKGTQAKRVKKTLDYLLRAFPEKTPELQRHSVVTLYCLASRLLDSYVYKGTEKILADWFVQFETERKKEEKLKDDPDKDPVLMEYQTHTSNASDAERAIRFRLDLITTRFFQKYPDIELKDERRGFSEEQKRAIWRRDNRKCQIKKKCDGKQNLPWENWEADHIKPHSKGGKTIVSNGRVSCVACNRSKGNKTE